MACSVCNRRWWRCRDVRIQWHGVNYRSRSRMCRRCEDELVFVFVMAGPAGMTDMFAIEDEQEAA